MNAVELRKIACQFCGGHLQFEVSQEGRVAPCPHCGQEIPLELPPPPPVLLLPPPPIASWPAPAPSFQPIPAGPPPLRRRIMTLIVFSICAFFVLANVFQTTLMHGLLAGAVIFFYFFPAMVAEERAHRNAISIGVLNLFLGWTFIGWVLALVWAFMEERK